MNKFCLVPWYGKEFQRKNNKTSTACCWLLPNHDLDQVKKDFLDNRSPTACQRCWQNENTFIKSRRQQENQYYAQKLKTSVDNLVAKCHDGTADPMFYQISLSNLCNQACTTCNGGSSTRWQSIDPKPYHDYFSKDLNLVDINWDTAKRISILGGEPLYDPKTYELLDKLINANNTDCDIVFVTNGSVAISEKQKTLFKRFPNTQVSVSVDGTGPLFDYLRWPGKWHDLLLNLQEYKEIFSDVNVSYTISTLNFWHHDQTVEWFESQNLNYNFNFVHYPAVFNVLEMPVELKKKITSEHLLSKMIKITGKEIAIDDLRKEILRQDNLKKIFLKDYLPDVYDLIFVDS